MEITLQNAQIHNRSNDDRLDFLACNAILAVCASTLKARPANPTYNWVIKSTSTTNKP